MVPFPERASATTPLTLSSAWFAFPYISSEVTSLPSVPRPFCMSATTSFPFASSPRSGVRDDAVDVVQRLVRFSVHFVGSDQFAQRAAPFLYVRNDIVSLCQQPEIGRPRRRR